MKINTCNDELDLMVDTQKGGENLMANVLSCVHGALKDATALCYLRRRKSFKLSISYADTLHCWMQWL